MLACEVDIMGISYMRLRELLIARNIQLKMLELEAKVNHNTLAKIRKDRHMSTESLEKIARYLGVEPGELFGLKD
jgi:DNA-binding Xre family transcriptional regulator